MGANFLKQLFVSGFVHSMRGQRGGYILAKSTNVITLVVKRLGGMSSLYEMVH